MDVKIFFLLFIFQIRVVVSKDCSCYVGYAKHTGEVHLQLEECPPLPTMPPSIKSTSAAPTTTQQKPDNTTQKPATTAQKPATTAQKPATTAQKPATTAQKPATTAQKPATTGTNITTSEPIVTTETLITTSEVPQSSTENQDVSTSAGDKTNASTPNLQNPAMTQRTRRDMPVQIQHACCQIAFTKQNQSKKLLFNATGWTVEFNCSNNSLENVVRCNNSGCNDIGFFKTRFKFEKQFKVPNECTNVTKSKGPIKTEDFLFETINSDLIESCNNQSRNKCSKLNLTQATCPSQSDFCCCPLPDGLCSKTPPPISTTLPASPRPSKKHGAHKSFDWRIVGYIGIFVICGLFLTFVGRMIHGKKKNDQLEIPNYKYSRLRADYVDQEP
ncbi:uncharacterized protein LOC117113990 isoform X2 [Anneissia japonica]|uniref:uncharacterized protein LOC117113990 isoform X2 n=1 Tax=Anneissia japonica TaxID=1529436 RepID=UPI0014255416|nr:uncharacterized protein LOC117113990 isoform X2 [Anneissia japonica]